MKTSHYILAFCLALCMLTCTVAVNAQDNRSNRRPKPERNTDIMPKREADSIQSAVVDTALALKPIAADSLVKVDSTKIHHKRDWATWKPNPQRALWLALVLPGAGQIYNRKYWKLPIFYGGFVGCAYAMRWNNMMYRDYSQAYLDIMDDDPNTQSYNQFLHLGTQITPQNQARWQEVFRKRKDRYRRYRDLSFFAMLAVYGLSVIDAYVDASLSEFDISPDLSLKVSPAVINNGGGGTTNYYNAFRNTGLGLNCCIQF